MAGDDDGARPGAQGLLQFVAEPGREMVGRLVEQEQVRRVGDEHREAESTTLSDREFGHRAVEVRRSEQTE